MSENDCTTDAIPSPPRSQENVSASDDIKSKPKVSESDEEYEEDEENFKQQHKNKSKRNTHYPVNQSAIHISHAGTVHFGNIFYIGGKNTEGNLGRRVEETDKIKMLKNSSKPVTTKDIGIVSHYMSKHWQDTARALGYGDPEIDQFIYANPKNLKQTIYDFLRDWIQNQGPHKATVGLLAHTLWDNQQREAVEKWSEKYSK